MGLTKAQFAELKQALDARSEEFAEKVRETLPKPADETTLERTGMAQDEVDDATTGAAEHLNHTMHTHYLAELRQIEAARSRAAEGLLGCCSDCGGEVGYARLRAQPFALRCVDCQERHERRMGAMRR